MTLVWGWVILLTVAVMLLVWMQLKQQKEDLVDHSLNRQLEQKVLDLEQHLQKTLVVVQDLAKGVYAHREQLSEQQKRIATLEQQHAELVGLFAQHLKNQAALKKIKTKQSSL